MKLLKYLLACALVMTLAACGGGGGSPGSTGNNVTTPGSTPGSSTTTATVSVPSVVVGVFNTTGTTVSGISLGGGFVARATVKDAGGAPVTSKVVTFAVVGVSIASVAPATALTNAQGVAEVALAPVSVSSVGAAAVSATADVSGATVVGRADFAVQSTSLSLGNLVVGAANLPSGGNTSVQTTALIGGSAASGVPVNVTFSAACGKINGQDTAAGGVSVTTNGSGIATAIYDAVSASGTLCNGPVTITGSSAGATPRSVVVNVAAPTASTVVFVSALPSQIFVAGTGAADQAIVRFRVLSSTGVALPGVDIKFSIVTNPGGIGLNAADATAPVTVSTLSTGEATVSVFSGSIPGPVKVRAELVSSSTTFAETQNLTVASGPPSQKFMSLSVETFNIEGWNRDGTSTQLTVRLADRQGNAVDDGTVVNFTAEGGQVARSCTTARVLGISQCSVTFVSQNPRPIGGRVSVLAFTEGTKDYVDFNGNNKFDANDTLINIGDAYRDDDEDGAYIAGEFLIPRGATGAASCPTRGGEFPSRGALPSGQSICDGGLQTTVRQQAVILFSSSNPQLVVTAKNIGEIAFQLRSSDNILLPVPAGTTFTAVPSGTGCSVSSVSGTPVVNVLPGTNPSASLATNHSVGLTGCAAGNTITFNVTVPSGLTTSFPIVL